MAKIEELEFNHSSIILNLSFFKKGNLIIMKKLLALAIMALSLIFTAGLVYAGTFRSPDKDTTCDSGNCFDGFGITIIGSDDLGGGCTADQIGLIGWTTNEPTVIQSATLTLTVKASDDSNTFNTTAGTYSFSLVEPMSHMWAETGVNPGLTANVLATSTPFAITGADEKVVFSSVGLGNYFEGFDGIGPATVGVVMTSGCSVGSTVVFQDNNPAGRAPNVGAEEPDLVFFNPPPTAVTLSDSGISSSPNTIVLVGIIALISVSIASMFVLRNRKSAVLEE